MAVLMDTVQAIISATDQTHPLPLCHNNFVTGYKI
jgi:hypothetical protein